MRKLFLLVAAFMAFRGGRGVARSGHNPAMRGGPAMRNGAPQGKSGFGIGSLLGLWFAPRWLRPLLLARAARRTHR